jgi:hypothetical protein
MIGYHPQSRCFHNAWRISSMARPHHLNSTVCRTLSLILLFSMPLLLSGQEVSKEDLPKCESLKVFVHYDYMGYADGQAGCSTDDQCTSLGSGHAGERCIGPAVLPSAPHSCVFTCTTNDECTDRGGGHLTDRCIENRCKHTHDPQVIAPGAMEEVVDAYARHGIKLIIDPVHRELPHSQVLAEFGHQLSDMSDFCEGGSLASGTAGIGKYAESFDDLKAAFFHSEKSENAVVHYAVFGHYTTNDSPKHSQSCTGTGLIPVPPGFGASGLAVINGGLPVGPLPNQGNFMVTLGGVIQDRNVRPTVFNVGGTFMHELGHNLGLRHGGGSDFTHDAEDTPTFKPNFLSVMNYSFQLSGIQVADAIGSYTPKKCVSNNDCSDSICASHTCRRLDYSRRVLPTGGNTPGALTEGGIGLNEVAGLGSGTADLTYFDDGACNFGFQPTTGPLDFDGDGNFTGTNVSVDLNRLDHPAVMACPSGVTETLTGHDDWQDVRAALASSNTRTKESALAPVNGNASPELTADMAQEHHVLYPPRSVEIQIRPGCQSISKPVAPGQRGPVTIVVLGDDDLDVNEIELSSVKFADAPLASASMSDVNLDGKPDLIAIFDMAGMKLHPGATSARVTGWLKNSQIFAGTGQIAVVPRMDMEDASCRQ